MPLVVLSRLCYNKFNQGNFQKTDQGVSFIVQSAIGCCDLYIQIQKFWNITVSLSVVYNVIFKEDRQFLSLSKSFQAE